MKIVVVEDEKRTRNGIINFILQVGGNLNLAGVASNGEDGLSLIKETRPDLVITDIKMPAMNGLDMLQNLKDAGVSCKTVILSGYAEFDFAKTAIRLGVSDYLLKPVTVKDLIQMFKKIGSDIEYMNDALSSMMCPVNSDDDNCNFIITRAITIINNEYAKDISLSNIADRLNVTTSYLSAVFYRKVGKNYSVYLRDLRIRIAKELLTNTHLKSYEIAQKVGYPDSKYFCRVFRETTGLSTVEYKYTNK